MRIAYHGFFGKNHSWSVVAQNFVRVLLCEGHEVDVFSTNGLDKVPYDLLRQVKGHVEGATILGQRLSNDYDASLSYTAMKNAGKYLEHSQSNRNLIWCYEFAGQNSLPTGFAKFHHFADRILAPSCFARDVFISSGVPEEKVSVVPHGINDAEIMTADPIKFGTDKRVKFLVNLGQVHARKNLAGALAMWGKAFKKSDDVCLIIKVQEKKPEYGFELNFQRILQDFKQQCPKHAEIEVLRNFLPNIYSLYKGVDFTFSPSHCEGFGMVPLEGMACGVYPIASRYGGFMDFLSNDNSLLIDGNSDWSVPSNYAYYQQRAGLKAFMPSIESGVACLRNAYENAEKLSQQARERAAGIVSDYSWKSVLRNVISEQHR